jgi:cysteine peptidase B
MAAATTSAQEFDALFLQFKRDFNRQYSSVAEEASRRATFETNMREAARLEKENPKATFGLTDYADVDATEFQRTHRNADFSSAMAQRKPITVSDVAGSSVNWVAKGAVTPIKNQKKCGGCWSFSTTGNMEGQWFLAGNPLTSLSEQELLSCDQVDGNKGCGGGNMVSAWKWLVSAKNGQIASEASYPFVSGSGNVPACSDSGRTVGATINGHVDLPQDEDKIAAYVYTHGPVSIGVDSASLQSYTGGIMTNCASTQLDHAVLIVGYDDTHSTPYWVIKNQWGTTWGEEGYFRVQKGTNQCGLKEFACTSTVAPSSGQATPAPAGPVATPLPPAPPAPSGATFTQKVCSNAGCSSGCQSHTFKQNTCLSLQGGGSAKASCGSNGLTMTEYPTSSSCSGSSVPSTQAIDQCVKDQSGSYLENICSNANVELAAAKLRSTRKI